jgi:hypothetical protein
MTMKWIHIIGFLTAYSILDYIFDFEQYIILLLFMILVMTDIDTFSS